MKKTISLLLSVILLLSVLPFGVPAQRAREDGREAANAPLSDVKSEDEFLDGFFYTVSQGEATVTGASSSFTGDASIPSSLGGFPVTAVGESAFAGNGGLTSVTIPDTVVSIGKFAFEGCHQLAAVTLPDSVLSIGASAFSGTAWLQLQPDGVVYIGRVVYGMKNVYPSTLELRDGTLAIAGNAFYNYGALQSIQIPASVKSIGDSAFYNCKGLTSIALPASVKTIGSSVFYGCHYLKTVSIPTSVTAIGSYAFANCRLLSTVTIPDSVRTIGEGAFSGCTYLEGVSLSSSLTSIGASAFYKCEELEAISIPHGVTEIGEEAFYKCSSLKNVTVPDSVTKVGASAFADTPFWKAMPEGVQYVGKVLYQVKGECPAAVTVREGTVGIAGYAFYNCTALTSISLPASVKSIGEFAFYDCTALTSLTLPAAVTYVGDAALACGSNLKTVFYGGSRFAWKNANASDYGNDFTVYYHGCSETAHLYSSECDAACDRCMTPRTGSLTAHSFEGGSDLCRNCGAHRYLKYEVNDQTEGWMIIGYSGSLGKELILPDKIESHPVTAVAGHCFKNCTSLSRIDLGSFVTELGSRCFYGCSGLTDVFFPLSLTFVGEAAFNSCGDNVHVWYEGSEAELEKVLIERWNGSLVDVGVWHFDSCKPTEHTFDNACDAGCNACEFIRTVPDHVFDSLCDGDCSVCGLERIPPHDFDSVCDETCGNCGLARRAPHDYENGTCKLCKKPDDSTGKCFWKLSGTALTIYGDGSMGDYDPAEIGYFPAPWGTSVTKVILEEGVVNVGHSAFRGCKKLTSVFLSASTLFVEENAFLDCTALTDVWYEGTQADRAALSVKEGNEALLSATWHYNTCKDGAHVYAGETDDTCEKCDWKRVFYTPGDLDGKEGVDSADAIYLLYHTLLGSGRYPVNQPVDYNKDGTVSSADAIYLLYHTLLGAGRYPLG